MVKVKKWLKLKFGEWEYWVNSNLKWVIRYSAMTRSWMVLKFVNVGDHMRSSGPYSTFKSKRSAQKFVEARVR